MNPKFLNQIKKTDALNTQKFEARKGFFIIEADPVMTENQIVNIEQVYQLVEFKTGGDIQLRDVVFWHANMKIGMLKLIVYDISNKVVISKMYDTRRPYNYSDWFLIEPEVFDGELLEFQ